MSFEAVFEYHEKKQSGGYDTENKKEFTKFVGKGAEEVPLEDVAKVVLRQLARRDVWVTDVSIYEITKKKISFSEAKGGIIIKHKKFMLDGSASSDEIVEPEIESVDPVPVTPQKKSIVRATPQKHPIRYEIFDPQVHGLAEACRQRGFKFTLGKKYPIFEEKPTKGQYGMVYTTVDDAGVVQYLTDVHFTPEIKMLEQGFESNEPLYVEKLREQRLSGPISTFNPEQASIPDIVNPLARTR